MTSQPDETLAENRYQFVERFIAANPARVNDAIIFDIGAGAFPMRQAIKDAGYALRGFDLAPQSTEIEQWDITQPFQSDGRADIILLMDVIEHVFNPGAALANIRAVLKPGGILIMTMPNPRWSRARTMHLFTGYIAAFTQHDLETNHHVFATWPHIVMKMCTDAGLSVQSYVTLDKFEGRTPGASPIRWIEAAVRKLVEARDRSACGMHYALILRPD